MLPFVLSSLVFSLAAGHGAMQFPQPRNVVYSNYCPHCANGAGVCGDGTNSQWISTTEPSQLDGAYSTPLRTKLIAGGKLEVEIYFTAVHLGIFAVEICSHPGATITEDCFVKLERDPTDTAVSPYIAEYPAVFYLPEDDCTKLATQKQPLRARFLVPEDALSEHAILRYDWNTGNSCGPNPLSTSPADARIADWSFSFNGQTCGLAISVTSSCGADCPNASCAGEKFKNCADVVVVDGDAAQTVSSDNYEVVDGTAPPVTAPPVTAAPVSTATAASSPTDFPLTQRPRTTAAAGATGAACGSRFESQIETCKANIQPLQSWNAGFCQDVCTSIGNGTDASSVAWCQARGLCDDLTECVATHWSSVCKA